MRAQLLHLSGPLRGCTTTYVDPTVLLGSGRDCQARIVGPAVAPRHARIDWVEAQCAFHLRALDGQVFVNGAEVAEVLLQDEDQLELGIGGPILRFRVYVPEGAVCKPVRRMLADARAVGKVSGGVAATRSLSRDLLTQATLQLKVGFPLLVIGLAFLASWVGGWLGSQSAVQSSRRTADSVSRAELEELRAAQAAQQQALAAMAQANAVVRRIQQEWSRGVCLLHGIVRFRLADGSWFAAGDEPLEIEYTGTGFLASAAGHVITNRHVVAPWLEMREFTVLQQIGAVPEFVHLAATFPGRAPIEVSQQAIRRRDDDLDVAVISLTADTIGDIPVLPLQQQQRENDGQRAVVVGYPTGLAVLLARADESTVEALRHSQATMRQTISTLAATGQISPLLTQGIVSNVDEHKIVYDAPTTHGGSGGPVFDGNGEVIAVNFAIMPGYVGANFGVPIRYARELLPE